VSRKEIGKPFTTTTPQEMNVRTRILNQPPSLHRQITIEDALPNVTKLVEDGWYIVECRLERRVEVQAVRYRVPKGKHITGPVLGVVDTPEADPTVEVPAAAIITDDDMHASLARNVP
jgi:hypothetical protein